MLSQTPAGSGVYAAWCRAETWLAAALLTAMVLLIFCAGVARLLHMPLNWTIDAATCLFAWACFLCADVAWRRDALMSLELVTGRLSARGRRLCAAFNYAVIALFLLYVAGAGAWLSWVSRARSFQGIPEISYSWVTLSMPVGAVLLLWTLVRKVRAEFGAEGAPC